MSAVVSDLAQEVAALRAFKDKPFPVTSYEPSLSEDK